MVWRKLRWICHKHSDYVVQQVETPGKLTTVVAQQIYLVVRHYFHVPLEVSLYHDCNTSRFCNKRMFSLTACEVLKKAAPFLPHLHNISSKTLIP